MIPTTRVRSAEVLNHESWRLSFAIVINISQSLWDVGMALGTFSRISGAIPCGASAQLAANGPADRDIHMPAMTGFELYRRLIDTMVAALSATLLAALTLPPGL